MTEREAMLLAIRTQPFDDTVRLAYADWLDEHDEPVEAAWIRWDTHLRDDVPRPLKYPGDWYYYDILFAGLGARNIKAVRNSNMFASGWCDHYMTGGGRADAVALVERGFVGSLRTSFDKFTDESGWADDLFRTYPITALWFADAPVISFVDDTTQCLVWNRSPWVDLIFPDQTLHAPLVWRNTEEEARADMSRLAVDYARARVGLPPLFYGVTT